MSGGGIETTVTTKKSPELAQPMPTLFQTIETGLVEQPDCEYFTVNWTLPENSFGAIVRRGDNVHAALVTAVTAELQEWIDMINDSGIDSWDMSYETLEPILDGQPSTDN